VKHREIAELVRAQIAAGWLPAGTLLGRSGSAAPWAIKTGTELAAEAEQSLVEIDAEIARVT
jgi:hypothetical protein